MRFQLVLILAFSILALAADKPSPFSARISVPAVPPMAPVSPVVPISILRAARQKSFAIMSVPETVSPVNRPFEASPEPSLFPAVPQLKTIVLTVPAMVVPEMVVAQLRPPQVNDIAKGAAKTEVVARLGNPSTVISMSEEGRFLESLRYDWQGKWLGTVRLVNGRVALVEQP